MPQHMHMALSPARPWLAVWFCFTFIVVCFTFDIYRLSIDILDYLTTPHFCQRILFENFQPPEIRTNQTAFNSLLPKQIAQQGHRPLNCFVLRISAGTANRSTTP